jgi:hypothetical protein
LLFVCGEEVVGAEAETARLGGKARDGFRFVSATPGVVLGDIEAVLSMIVASMMLMIKINNDALCSHEKALAR